MSASHVRSRNFVWSVITRRSSDALSTFLTPNLRIIAIMIGVYLVLLLCCRCEESAAIQVGRKCQGCKRIFDPTSGWGLEVFDISRARPGRNGSGGLPIITRRVGSGLQDPARPDPRDLTRKYGMMEMFRFRSSIGTRSTKNTSIITDIATNVPTISNLTNTTIIWVLTLLGALKYNK